MGGLLDVTQILIIVVYNVHKISRSTFLIVGVGVGVGADGLGIVSSTLCASHAYQHFLVGLCT